jgi:hypothetical protein
LIVFEPQVTILPVAQRALWPELAEIPKHFVLYGGTGLALRLGHRDSVDFDFFSSEQVVPLELLRSLSLLKNAKIIQNVSQTLGVIVDRKGPVKLSFFGNVAIGRVGTPDETADGVLQVASILDLAGTKAAVITQRSESKDYIDMLALINSGISLPTAMAAARSIYGAQYNPMLTVKSLTYFGDGDLHKLTSQQKTRLIQCATAHWPELPEIPRLSDKLAGFRPEAKSIDHRDKSVGL